MSPILWSLDCSTSLMDPGHFTPLCCSLWPPETLGNSTELGCAYKSSLHIRIFWVRVSVCVCVCVCVCVYGGGRGAY